MIYRTVYINLYFPFQLIYIRRRLFILHMQETIHSVVCKIRSMTICAPPLGRRDVARSFRSGPAGTNRAHEALFCWPPRASCRQLRSAERSPEIPRCSGFAIAACSLTGTTFDLPCRIVCTLCFPCGDDADSACGRRKCTVHPNRLCNCSDIKRCLASFGGHTDDRC